MVLLDGSITVHLFVPSKHMENLNFMTIDDAFCDDSTGKNRP